MKYLKVLLSFGFVIMFASASFAATQKGACIDCHKKVTPGVVQQHLEGKMSKKGVDCSSCHGSGHKKMTDAKLAKMPTPALNAIVHPTQNSNLMLETW